MREINLTTTFLVVLALFVVSCGKGGEKSTNKTNSPEIEQTKQGQSAVIDTVSAANVLQVAESLDDFKTLVVAVHAAGVEDALVNAGPLTVFAPVNAAFDKLPEGTVEDLLKPENKSKLGMILKNHVAPANYPDTQLSKEAKKGRKLYMASGKYLIVEEKEDGIYVGGTKILKTVQVSNGWIHVIDNVLVPTE
ncbi:fasciclin domain-containing protein [Lutibacter sp.]|uniref:fasciclin domain-containing protein n=1 Tax=Lutibacter sp. TaxID=1925666 RepID=UPI0035682510